MPEDHQYETQPLTKSEIAAYYRYSMIRFKQTLSLIMIIITALAMIIGITAIAPVSSSYHSAVNYADDMSSIRSKSGNSVAEAYYQDHGDFLEKEVAIIYSIAYLLGGFYEIILLFALVYWIYLFKKSSFQRTILEADEEFE